MFIAATQPICCYSFEMQFINRSDIFTSIWNKIHGYSDTIEITGYLNASSVEKFTLFFGRRSCLTSNGGFNQMKTFCQEFPSSGNTRLPAYITTLTEGSEIAASIIKSELIDELAAQIEHFNYLYVTDIVDQKLLASFNTPLLDLHSNYLVLKLSLTLTSPKLWNYTMNNLDGLMNQFAAIVQTMSSVRLSKETKQNIERSRVKLSELRVKQDHQHRQENAMKKKDEKVRQLKDKIRTEPDSEKQIKLQEKFQKLELKEKQKKMSKGKSLKLIA
uniref:PAT complex subunit CCDC47 n=1 Tax=Myxobolus squamalis TaxID=59785 RepID=A0A6B2FXC3_MYXSQ